jgi:3-deoxy-D-manno-octulosonic-acid transferase
LVNWEYLAYRCAVGALLPFALIRQYWKSRHYPNARGRWKERLGYFKAKHKHANYIWIHAVSVGESNAAEPLIDKLMVKFPKWRILMTTTTATGAENVSKRYGDDVEHAYFPYDLKSCLARFFDTTQPKLVILIETELWPNFLSESAARKIPVLLINGRLSEKAAERYSRAPRLIKQMLHQISAIAAQSKDDAARFISLGAEPANVVSTGSLKFDREINHSIFERGEALRRELGMNRFILIAGSTREDEEEIMLDGLTSLTGKIPGLLVILAPRHPERFTAVAELLTRRGISFARYQQSRVVDEDVDVFLLDAMGELANYYAAADVAYVGGSLLPYGGHNTLEPAGLGVPIVVGPHTYNFKEINAKLADSGALITVMDAGELHEAILKLSADSNLRDAMGQSGLAVFLQNRGALSKVEKIIEEYLALAEQ